MNKVTFLLPVVLNTSESTAFAFLDIFNLILYVLREHKDKLIYADSGDMV